MANLKEAVKSFEGAGVFKGFILGCLFVVIFLVIAANATKQPTCAPSSN